MRGSPSDARGEAGGNPMRRIPPLNEVFEVACRTASDGWFASGTVLWAAAQRRLSGGDIDDHRIAEGGTVGWVILRLRGGYAWRKVQIILNADNLGDAAYRLHGSGIDGAGRQLSVELALRW